MRISAFTLSAIVGLVSVVAATAARAEDCDNAVDQASMNQCAGEAFKKSDAELNTLYKQIIGRLKDDQDKTRLLVSAQKAWVAFRDAECKFSSSGSAQGSIHPMTVLQCRDELTQNRVEDLKDYLNCQEGDLTCPVPAAN